MKVNGDGTSGLGAAPSTDHGSPGSRFECERACWDPKDGELCLNRAKPGETLVEARSDSDVQIDRDVLGRTRATLMHATSFFFPWVERLG